MKITVLQESLSKALLFMNRAVSSKPNIPVLANVLIEAEKGKVKFSATDLEIGISTWIGAEVSEEGSLTVSAKMLSDFVNSLKRGKIEMGEKEGLFEVNFVDNNAAFYIIPADDFPKVPEAQGEVMLEINALKFADAIALTSFSASMDESRPVLTGVLMNAKSKRLTLVGVDGFRLSKKEMDLEKEIKQDEFKEIIPAKSLIEVEKIIRDVCDDKSIVKVYYLGAKNQLLFKIEEIELSTRLIEGEFPDYEKIIPKDSRVKFDVDREELANTIKIVSIFAKNVTGNKTIFALDAETQKLSLSASVVDVGKNKSQLSVNELLGDDLETAYNIRFLTDMTNAIKSTTIHFESNGSVAPGVFLNPEDKDFIHIIMPMRLD